MKLFKVHKPCLIFASNDPARTVFDLTERGIPFKRVAGRYDGQHESSFVVLCDRAVDVLALARADEQQCILHLDEYRKAFEIDVDLGVMGDPVGQWQSTNQVRDGENYTYDGSTGTHYVVR